nr:MAG TPA: DNA (cytosine-5)-methyltransferase 3A [Caudoviricetes sp.]
MKVLIACEESQAVCIAFRAKGHEAYSADIQDCSGGHPEWHIKGDVLPIINGNADFVTMDGTAHRIEGTWDLLIAHPPCTYLSNAGAARLYKKIGEKSYVELERLSKGFDAKEFFLKFLNASIDKIAVENPIPSGVYRLPKYSQVIQPYEYGHPYSKRTCLWLKGLPKLEPTEIVKPICSWVSGGSKKADGSHRENKGTAFRDSKRRSKTFPGIAKAMAEQWG